MTGSFVAVLVVAAAIVVGAEPAAQTRAPKPRNAAVRQRDPAPAAGDFTLFVAGDTVITREWTSDESAQFRALIDEVRAADAAIVSLEMLLHDFDGVYPERYDGQGPPRAADPALALQLQWAGIDIVNAAHDHTYDYGALGVLATQRHVEGAGLVVAGAGRDLQQARGPAYYYSAAAFVGVVAASSSYTRWGVATRSRPELHGKPGLNPLGVRVETTRTITPAAAKKLVRIAEEEEIEVDTASIDEKFDFLGQTFVIGEANAITHEGAVSKRDLAANLASVAQARKDANAVIFSLHAHRPGAWVEEVAHNVLDAGADVFVAHGAPGIRGVEIYNGKLALYGLGNFVFQEETIERLPAEYLEAVGLPAETPARDAMRRVAGAWDGDPRHWRSLAAVARFESGSLAEVRLLPLDLEPERGFGARGTPRLANPELGSSIVELAASASRQFGTRISYDAERNVGVIQIR